ncbi:hypothetical protein B0H19DRAFT_1071314 [Mycena capillaripes]|nr:hypothetical protein B0H19DRAFT_1071314 [Mycena capillaripes]
MHGKKNLGSQQSSRLASASGGVGPAAMLGTKMALATRRDLRRLENRMTPTAIYTDLPAALIPGVVRAYTASLRLVFVLGVPVAGLALLLVMFIYNLRIEKTVLEPNSNDPGE